MLHNNAPAQLDYNVADDLTATSSHTTRATQVHTARLMPYVYVLQSPELAVQTCIIYERNTHTHTHTHTHPFNGPLSGGTTQVSWYQILLKQEIVSGSGISWNIGLCKSAPCSRQITTLAPHHSVFTGRMPFLPPNQQHRSTEGNIY